MKFDRKKHWEKIYASKNIDELSWFQRTPNTSISFIKQIGLKTNNKIIDIGGGDSLFVDNMIKLGFRNITVLDISENAIAKAKKRLGVKAKFVQWIVSDVSDFKPSAQYDFWHDRAAFHFLTKEKEIEYYINTIRENLSESGFLVLGTFSDNGPDKCSGIHIQKYSEETMQEKLGKYFRKIKCITEDHITPSKTVQNFIFCSFQKLRFS